MFSSKCKMLRTVKMNQKNNPKFMAQNWKCSECLNIDAQEHLLWCPGFAHLRTGKDLKSDKDLVSYYRSVIKLRESKDD